MPQSGAYENVLRDALTADSFDSATGGVNREASLYPVIKLITGAGVQTVPDATLKPLYESQVVRYV